MAKPLTKMGLLRQIAYLEIKVDEIRAQRRAARAITKGWDRVIAKMPPPMRHGGRQWR